MDKTCSLCGAEGQNYGLHWGCIRDGCPLSKQWFAEETPSKETVAIGAIEALTKKLDELIEVMKEKWI